MIELSGRLEKFIGEIPKVELHLHLEGAIPLLYLVLSKDEGIINQSGIWKTSKNSWSILILPNFLRFGFGKTVLLLNMRILRNYLIRF